MDYNYIITLILVVYIVFYCSDLTKGYPLKLVELLNEKVIILLFITIVAFLVKTKKYTLAILTMIVVLFIYLNIPMLTETFISPELPELAELPDLEGFQKILTKEQKSVFENLQNISGAEIIDSIDMGNDHIEGLGDIIEKLEEKILLQNKKP
jgi:hypothetical protein